MPPRATPRLLSLLSRLPLASGMGNWSITIEGRQKAPGENPNSDFQVVMPGYLEAMRAELVHGRLPAYW